ncbi:phosphonate ABC transporter, permease protein PhnE [Chelatococcus asaccharovorans]|uniref:Phosphonate transport system permease protein n=1 Tax=Chelatococcus asaccharovorans TaxID=28210 RepID=A0A2V3TZF4_9HYPH|nr:phosphonate ABC transporter, permease protein PhnE [Chelatococcus asaccharovorans]MBS7707706.1 phosphonate ABC transporter, permease protein PhnE [Chelatococcus asaccharovorans]PXW55282.1 phosphonate transport system permease protein [Chelatococcus asaccharovorans]
MLFVPTRPPIEGIIAEIETARRLPRRQRLAIATTVGILLGTLTWCLYAFDFSPQRLWHGLGRLGDVVSFMLPPYIWTTWDEWRGVLGGLGETIAMAFMGTLIGAIVAFPLSFLGARVIVPMPWLRLASRRGFDTLRAVETIILALVFIRAFGLGPLAGVLAIAVSEVGTLAKVYSEAMENTSARPVEGVRAVGAGPLQTIRYAILPQALPVMLSAALYQFESNVRSSTILGIVGAGGIGFLLSDRIRAYHWQEAWSIIFLIVLAVFAIDTASGWLRMRIIDPRPAATP